MMLARGDDNKPTLIPLPQGGIALSGRPVATSSDRRSWRSRILPLSFVLFVLLPALAGALYFSFFASDRFSSGAGFAIRSMDNGRPDIIGAMTGLHSGQAGASDAYILLNYLRSRDLVERLAGDVPLREHFGAGSRDWLSRLGPDVTMEGLTGYWSDRLHASYNSATGILAFEVEAFDPATAYELATRVLSYCQEMVNELSRQARQDSLSFATTEVARAEIRLKRILESIRAFRETEKSIDPEGSARIHLELVGNLEQQLADLRTRISTLQSTLDDNAPSLRAMIRHAEALEHQIRAQRASLSGEMGASGSSTLTLQLATYETLEVERDFAQQYYASALSSLENARVNADRHQRYLAVYSHPAVPQEAAYPRRLLNILLLATSLGLAWAIGALLAYAIRDHLT